MDGFDLHIVPGYRCNLTCDHCVSSSGPNEKLALTDSEIDKIETFAKWTKINFIYFSGGEPTYHIPILKKIMSAEVFSNTPAGITSNGWYLSNGLEFTKKLLERIPNLKNLQVSHDRFHGLLSEDEIEVLCLIQDELDLNVSVSYCIRSHKDIAAFVRFKAKFPQLQVHYQKVESAGRAKETDSGFEYKTFESAVLDKGCPNSGSISYICGKGFTICCSSGVFNESTYQKAGEAICHDEGKTHVESEFYQAVTTGNFKQLAESKNIDLSSLNLEANDSSECSLCEKIMLA